MIYSEFFTTVLDFFRQGGVFMIFLVFLSIVSLTVIILRGNALRYETVLPAKLQNAITALRPGQDIRSVQTTVKRSNSPLSRIVDVLLAHRRNKRSETLEAVQTKARHEVARMETGLVILEIATGVAPLFGLLGTLSGLIGIFSNLSGSGDPTLVARGIAEALSTTIVGLGVAAPSLIAYNYFMRKIEVMSVEMESLTADLLEKIYTKSKSSFEDRED
ncbi:MAG: MotA/TolQ/ExbB proton channel family protein [Chthoniobacterales bacterium]